MIVIAIFGIVFIADYERVFEKLIYSFTRCRMKLFSQSVPALSKNVFVWVFVSGLYLFFEIFIELRHSKVSIKFMKHLLYLLNKYSERLFPSLAQAHQNDLLSHSLETLYIPDIDSEKFLFLIFIKDLKSVILKFHIILLHPFHYIRCQTITWHNFYNNWIFQFYNAVHLWQPFLKKNICSHREYETEDALLRV